MLSLNMRVLLAGAIVLASFFGLAGVILQQAFSDNAESALKQRLLSQVYFIIAAAELDGLGQVVMPEVWTTQKFSMMSSNLHSEIINNSGGVVWRSKPMQDLNIPPQQFTRRNESLFQYIKNVKEERFASLSFAVAWDDARGAEIYNFSVAEKLDVFDQQAAAFQRKLWISLAGVAILLLILQSQIIRWELSPLEMAKDELTSIKNGTQDKLLHRYPGELKGLTDNLNGLLIQQQEHLLRYRNTMSDLAHSLKTPLAVMQSAMEGHDSDIQVRKLIQEQIDRINQIVEHQLQRAATAGQAALLAPISLSLVANKVIQSLSKVYVEKQVKVKADIDENIVLHADEGDLMEILGNVIDNAFKWCKFAIRVTIKPSQGLGLGCFGLDIVVEDDGQGIPRGLKDQVFHRGIRADESVDGYGIGLSVVKDIVSVYRGNLDLARSSMGGAKITVSLPDSR